MTDRPILFSAEMVRAILDGRKTQTRRVMNPQPSTVDDAGRWYRMKSGGESLMTSAYPCPYGAPGDTLWVRETCWAESTFDGDGVRYPADHVWRIIENTQEASEAWCKLARYGGDAALDNQTNTGMRVPSIHMPRWASRITLRITDIRVERLQDISEDDAKAEGCESPLTGAEAPAAGPGVFLADERTSFAILWNKINGAGAWGANPWVWAISFERVKP